MNETPKPRRRLISLTLLTLLLVGVTAASGRWYLHTGQWREATDNAYIAGNLIPISTRLAGTVVWVGTEENHYVEAGQVILRLDDSDERNQVQVLEQELALAARTVAALRKQDERYATEVSQRQVTHQRADEEHQRRISLAEISMVSQEELDAARTRSEETRIAWEIARSALDRSRQLSGDMPIEQHPTVMLAAARLRAAHLELDKTRIVSPVSGHIARRSVQLGQRVAPGDELMSLAQLNSVWVEANFKETQLTHVYPGQPVHMTSDLYGEDYVYTGAIVSLGSGTGAAFSLLPPQNATGNWIKIVQRVPVRIALSADSLRDHPLPIGASLAVEVDTHQRDADKLSHDSQAYTAVEAPLLADPGHTFEDSIARIIADNLDYSKPELSQR